MGEIVKDSIFTY